MFTSLTRNLSDPNSGVRAKAVRGIGKMARFDFIGTPEKATAKKAIERILGFNNDFEWDRAYVVRAEAEETIKYLS